MNDKLIAGLITKLRTRDFRDWLTLCPFHEEKTPSFVIRVRTDEFSCLACGKKGNILNLLSELLVAAKENEDIENTVELMHFIPEYLESLHTNAVDAKGDDFEENFITDVEEAEKVLPAWFTERMMTDTWTFGVLTTTNTMIFVETILNVSKDGQWINVELVQRGGLPGLSNLNAVIPGNAYGMFALEGREQASIAVKHIVAVYELANT